MFNAQTEELKARLLSMWNDYSKKPLCRKRREWTSRPTRVRYSVEEVTEEQCNAIDDFKISSGFVDSSCFDYMGGNSRRYTPQKSQIVTTSEENKKRSFNDCHQTDLFSQDRPVEAKPDETQPNRSLNQVLMGRAEIGTAERRQIDFKVNQINIETASYSSPISTSPPNALSPSPNRFDSSRSELKDLHFQKASPSSEKYSPIPITATVADLQFVKRAKLRLEESSEFFRDNPFIQPEERDINLLPVEIELKMKHLYTDKSHFDLVQSLKNITEKAEDLIHELNALEPLSSDAFRLISRTNKSVELHIDDIFNDENRTNQLRRIIFERNTNFSIVISKVDMAIIIVELSNAIDFLTNSLSSVCFDHSNFILKQIKRLKKSDPDKYLRHLVEGQKVLSLRLDRVENELRWSQQTLLSSQKKSELRFKSLFVDNVDTVLQNYYYESDSSSNLSDSGGENSYDEDDDSDSDDSRSSSREVHNEDKSYGIERFMTKKDSNISSWSRAAFINTSKSSLLVDKEHETRTFNRSSELSKITETISMSTDGAQFTSKSSINVSYFMKNMTARERTNGQLRNQINKEMYKVLTGLFTMRPLRPFPSSKQIFSKNDDSGFGEEECVDGLYMPKESLGSCDLFLLIDFKNALAITLPWRDFKSDKYLFTSVQGVQSIMMDLKATLSSIVVDSSKQIISALNPVINYLNNLEIDINSVQYIAGNCLEIDVCILNTQEGRKQYGFDIYFVDFCRFQLSCIYIFYKKSLVLKSMETRQLQQFLSLWYEQCLSEIILRLLPQLSELCNESNNTPPVGTAHAYNSLSADYLKILSDAISVFVSDSVLNKSFWVINNRVLFDAMKRRQHSASSLFHSFFPVHDVLIRNLVESKCIEKSKLLSLQECMTSRVFSRVDCFQDIDPVVFEATFVLILVSHIRLSLSNILMTSEEKQASKQIANWGAVRNLVDIITEASSTTAIKNICLLFLVEQMPSFAKIWDCCTEGLDVLFSISDILLRQMPPPLANPLLSFQPTGIEKFVVFQEKMKPGDESRFFSKAFSLLQGYSFNSTDLHTQRNQSSYDQAERREILKEMLSISLKLQSSFNLASVLDNVKCMEPSQSQSPSQSPINSSQAAVFVGKAISAFLKNCSLSSTSTESRRLQSFLSINDQSLMKLLSPKDHSPETQANRIIMLSEFFIDIYKVLGLEKLYNSDSENKSPFEKILQQLHHGNMHVSVSIEWILVAKLLHYSEDSPLSWDNYDYPVFNRIRHTVVQISQFDLKLHHVSKEVVNDVVLSLTIGNEIFIKLQSIFNSSAVTERLATTVLLLIKDLLALSLFGLSSSAGSPTDGLFECCIDVIRNTAIYVIKVAQIDR